MRLMWRVLPNSQMQLEQGLMSFAAACGQDTDQAL